MADAPAANGLRKDVEGRFANYFKAGFNAFEMILEFAQFYEDSSSPRMQARIVTSPAYAKVFLEVLRDSMEQYEKAYGPIAQEKGHE
jgi:Protein of unknown function (DUF3467)